MDKAHLIAMILLIVTTSVCAEEFQVNTRAAGAQCNPSIAATAEGDFVVAWSSYYSSSGRSNEIVARRFDRTGEPIDANEFQVNTTCEGNQTEPSVAIGVGGHVMIVWQGPGAAGVDVFARLFDPNGRPLTNELRVNAGIPGQHTCPRVAASENDPFVIVWESEYADTDAPASVWGQLLDAFGSKQGTEFLIAQDNWPCRYPDVAMDARGNFAVTWLLDRSSRSVRGRLFDPEGIALSEAFEVSEIDFSSITRPTIAMNSQGLSVITWDGDPNLASLDDIHARRFEPNSTPQSGQFLVNAVRDGAQQWPRVAINDVNGVVVVWQSDSNDPNLATDVFARRFDAGGRPSGRQVHLNTYVWDKQRYPDVAMATDGSFVTAWETTEPDGSDYDLFGKIVPALLWPDLNGDACVDLNDLQVLGRSWRLPGEGEPADLNQDDWTDARDLEILCLHWLQQGVEDD